MQLLPMDRLGARETAPGVVDFGVFLPWASAADGNRLFVRVIHEADQFLQEIPPLEFELQHAPDARYNDYWSAQVDLNAPQAVPAGSRWGQAGRYVYRYCLHNPNHQGEIDWIIDPFAREFGTGKLSAFTLGYEPHVWSAAEAAWQTPRLQDLVMYELMITEFAGDLDRAVQQLDYLADLGINCIEVMPVSNVAMTVDWGFLPIGYFGVDERFGKRKDFERFVDAAHQRGIAVILDSVYGHTSEDFPYAYLYKKLGYHENPFMGSFAKDYFGESTDFGRKFTRDFFFTVNYHWLTNCHVDGFRYDCVPNYWDGALGQGYAALTYETYQLVKQKAADPEWSRFHGGGDIALIQCAEQLEGPEEILEKTYSNCTWQNSTLGAAKSVAHGETGKLYELGLGLGLSGYPAERDANGDHVAKTALQYIENHDHSRFLCEIGTFSRDNELLREGDRSLWYRLQPYLIALLTSRGVPMLWQGQELGESYSVPDGGFGRVMMFRPVRWDFFYDDVGRKVLTLVRKLVRIRRENGQFRSGDHFFYNQYGDYQSKRVLLFSRREGATFSLVALNFGESDQTVPFHFPLGGDYREELHGTDELVSVNAGEEHWLTIPGNYGRIWTTGPVIP